jgi:hypothetical protein
MAVTAAAPKIVRIESPLLYTEERRLRANDCARQFTRVVRAAGRIDALVRLKQTQCRRIVRPNRIADNVARLSGYDRMREQQLPASFGFGYPALGAPHAILLDDVRMVRTRDYPLRRTPGRGPNSHGSSVIVAMARERAVDPAVDRFREDALIDKLICHQLFGFCIVTPHLRFPIVG